MRPCVLYDGYIGAWVHVVSAVFKHREIGNYGLNPAACGSSGQLDGYGIGHHGLYHPGGCWTRFEMGKAAPIGCSKADTGGPETFFRGISALHIV